MQQEPTVCTSSKEKSKTQTGFPTLLAKKKPSPQKRKTRLDLRKVDLTTEITECYDVMMNTTVLLQTCSSQAGTEVKLKEEKIMMMLLLLLIIIFINSINTESMKLHWFNTNIISLFYFFIFFNHNFTINIYDVGSFN